MNRIFLLAAIIISMAACQSPSANDTGGNDMAEISEVLNTQAAAWNDGNVEAYMQDYWNNDSLLFIGSKGPVYGYNSTLERYKKSYPDKEAMGSLSFSNLTFKRLSDEYYFVTRSWSLERKEDNPHGSFTLLFRKINGKWVIIADHSS